MKKYIVGILIILMIISPLYAVYGTSVEKLGTSITIGETTANNNAYKNSMIDYFQTKTDQDLNSVPMDIITANDVNKISKEITGDTYSSKNIFSCAFVDLNVNRDNIKVIVDKSKITTVTPKMYANALESAGINKGYVVVSSPIVASGEAALAGVLKSYESAVGSNIPDSVKKASTEELYLETELANETGVNGDKIADLFSEVKEQAEKNNATTVNDIKMIVINIANNMNINIDNSQAQDIAESVSKTQQVKDDLQGFESELNKIANDVQSSGLLDQIIEFIKKLLNL